MAHSVCPVIMPAGAEPMIVELGGAAYRINPVGASSPFTVESAYASVRTIGGRTGDDSSDEELIDEAKADMARRVLEESDPAT